MEADAELVQAERLDRAVEQDLAALDGNAACRHDLGDVARADRAVELAAVAGLADDDEAFAGELAGDGFGFRFQFEIAGLELRALALEALAVGRGGSERLALRQQEIAGEAVLDGHHVAHLAKPADALKKDHLHGRCSWFLM
jgi:hypothetical protein